MRNLVEDHFSPREYFIHPLGLSFTDQPIKQLVASNYEEKQTSDHESVMSVEVQVSERPTGSHSLL